MIDYLKEDNYQYGDFEFWPIVFLFKRIKMLHRSLNFDKFSTIHITQWDISKDSLKSYSFNQINGKEEWLIIDCLECIKEFPFTFINICFNKDGHSLQLCHESFK